MVKTGHTPPILSGHFLSILPTEGLPGTPPPCSNGGGGGGGRGLEGGSQEEGGGSGEDVVRLYLKQGFVVEGLREVLSTPGNTVLLKDVDFQQRPG